MSHRPIRLLLVLCLPALLVAWLPPCSMAAEPAKQLVGTWELDLDDFIAERSKGVGENEAALLKQALSAAGFRVAFEFKADGSSTMSKTLQPGKTSTASGTWKIGKSTDEGTVIEIKPEGKDRVETITVRFLDDDQLRVVAPKDLACLFRKAKMAQPK